ncbi:MAG TPA: magnesium and cobalt transport protein CorA [Burkholderiales bacterium]|jgi:magnesium transporter|nr:magnesium and cobalt transport protein CorA [Burkholderiales bacterium]
MLVNCAAYAGGRKLQDIRVEEVSAYMKQPGCFVWMALRDPTQEELAVAQREFDLHPLAVEDAQHGEQRPKIDEYGDSLFAVLRTVEPITGELNVGELCIFVGPGYVLSVRSHSERGFVEVRQRTEREPELLRHGPAYVFYALMDAAVDRYFPLLDALETELEAIEEQIFANKSPRANIEALYGLKQKLTIMKHAVGPLLEASSRLHGGRVPQLCAGLGDYFRDVYDHLVRLNQTADAIRDQVITAISVNLSMITLQENEVTKRLAAYAALVAVPTMIAGIYGMNFRHMPELDWAFGYPLALGAMFVIDAYLFYRFRKARWL